MGRVKVASVEPKVADLAPELDGQTRYDELLRRSDDYRDLSPLDEYVIWWDRPLRASAALPPLSGCTLVISPHPDDAEFSMGGWLVKHRDDREVVHALCFNQTGFTQYSDAYPTPCETSAVRNGEALLSAAALGLSHVEFDYPSFEIRNGMPGDGDPDELEQRIEQFLRFDLFRLISELNPDEVFAPAAIGSHPDHRCVFNVLMEYYDAGLFPDTTIHFYEDAPYCASYYEIDSFLARFETSYLTVRSWAEDTSDVAGLRNELCRIYQSQALAGMQKTLAGIGRRTGTFLPAGRRSEDPTPSAERFWTLTDKELLID